MYSPQNYFYSFPLEENRYYKTYLIRFLGLCNRIIHVKVYNTLMRVQLSQNLQGINSKGPEGQISLNAGIPYISDVIFAYNLCTSSIFNHLHTTQSTEYNLNTR